MLLVQTTAREARGRHGSGARARRARNPAAFCSSRRAQVERSRWRLGAVALLGGPGLVLWTRVPDAREAPNPRACRRDSVAPGQRSRAAGATGLRGGGAEWLSARALRMG